MNFVALIERACKKPLLIVAVGHDFADSLRDRPEILIATVTAAGEVLGKPTRY